MTVHYERIYYTQYINVVYAWLNVDVFIKVYVIKYGGPQVSRQKKKRPAKRKSATTKEKGTT